MPASLMLFRWPTPVPSLVTVATHAVDVLGPVLLRLAPSRRRGTWVLTGSTMAGGRHALHVGGLASGLQAQRRWLEWLTTLRQPALVDVHAVIAVEHTEDIARLLEAGAIPVRGPEALVRRGEDRGEHGWSAGHGLATLAHVAGRVTRTPLLSQISDSTPYRLWLQQARTASLAPAAPASVTPSPG